MREGKRDNYIGQKNGQHGGISGCVPAQRRDSGWKSPMSSFIQSSQKSCYENNSPILNPNLLGGVKRRNQEKLWSVHCVQTTT